MNKRVSKGMSLMLAAMLGVGTIGASTAVYAEDAELADEQVFYFSLNNEPATLDPWVNNSGAAGNLVAAVHEPMLKKTR